MRTRPFGEWSRISDRRWVLELDGEMTAPGPSLELHLDMAEGTTFGWWTDDDGNVLKVEPVGTG
jgi:hypothetical protein